MSTVKCPECGKEEPYNKNILQICWDCNQHMTLKDFPNPTLDIHGFLQRKFSEIELEGK